MLPNRTSKRLILLAGDSDFIPAVTAAKSEGVVIKLFHGERPHSDLWREADERTQDRSGLYRFDLAMPGLVEPDRRARPSYNATGDVRGHTRIAGLRGNANGTPSLILGAGLEL